jgi:hypothetical protein
MIGFRVAVTLFLVCEMIAASAANAADTFNVDGGYGTHQFVVLLRIGDGAFAGSTTIKFRPGKNTDYHFRVSRNDLFPAEDRRWPVNDAGERVCLRYTVNQACF